MSIKNKLQHIIKACLPIDVDVNKIVIEIPKDKKNGDYSSNDLNLNVSNIDDNYLNEFLQKQAVQDGVFNLNIKGNGFSNDYTGKCSLCVYGASLAEILRTEVY